MTTSLFGISFDTSNAARIADFWARALGRTISDGATAEYAAIPATDDAGAGPTLMFHQVQEDKTVKNRIHLDLISEDFDAEAARFRSLGASIVNTIDNPGGGHWITFADPDGNEFDLIRG